MEGASLLARDLACRRGDRLLFAGVSFTLDPGEALQVVGANGTGKSSLLRILAGLLRPFAGAVEKTGPVALLDGNLPLDGHLPLGRALAFWERIDGVNEALGWGPSGLVDVPVRFLSTGQRKRLALINAWLEERPVLVFDEWAADQDPTFRRIFYTELLPDLKRLGKTIIVISHDDRYFDVADQLVRMNAGKVLTELQPA